MDIKIEIAKEKDIEDIHDLIIKRCKWFKENNIKQWDMSYAKRYNKDYLKKQINTNLMYIARCNETIVGCMFLKSKDEDYWQDDKPSYYIHHLATNTLYKGIGKSLINFAISKARIDNKEYLRLDCFKSNIKLNNYYKNLGFENRGSGKIGGYTYNLWEVRI